MIELIAIGLIIACWVAGGQIKGRIRDVPTPIIIGAYFAFKEVWWLFLALGTTFQMIRLGWGNYSPEDDPNPSFLANITHDRNGWWIRAIWGFLAAGIGALPLIVGKWAGFCDQYMSLLWYAIYVVGNTLINFGVSRLRLPVLIADILVAVGIGSIIWLGRL